ncbi:hypothetical protein [Planctomycetes bacterium TBK1r]|uniref:Uncharacterized protein n=1 Tax=Stieleria magnilauensis TaxID=2527963 RepID=A0ABX5XYQ3_9BACT|nr:hypothetical protein TBK1r_50830 [Planctomycetes bacterium TBK1r]
MRRAILKRLMQGRRLMDIAVEHRVPYAFVQAVAAESGLNYAGQHLSDAQQREVRRRREKAGQSIREIAAEMGLPKSKIGRYSRRVYLDEAAEGDRIGFTEAARPKRCPVHGLVNVWPCVACTALGAVRD